jgi:uncharacterized protein
MAMAKENTIRRRLIVITIMSATALAAALPLTLMRADPAAAQFFPFFVPYQQPAPEPPKPPADYSRAPAAKKPETPPTTTIVVMGDSMADWLAYGLEDAFSDTPEIGIVRKHRAFSGLLRYEARSDLDWPGVARDVLAAETPSAVVMMLGLSDRQPIRERPPSESPPAPQQQRNVSSTLEYRSEPWVEAYSKKIDDTIAALKSKGIPVLWVSLPSIRGTKSTSDAAYLNGLFRAQAEKAGIVYVDAWDGFVDEAGKYSTYGPDLDGQTRSLRTPDGVHFTRFGARKLAHYVERELRRVMAVRSLPVSLPSDDGIQEPGILRPGAPVPRPVAGPVIPLTAPAVSTSEELLGDDRAAPRAPDPIAARVLVKGESLAPLKGRADDFLWPPGSGAVAEQPAPDQSSDVPSAAATTPSPAPAPAVAPPERQDDAGKKAAITGKQTTPGSPASRAERSQASAAAPARKKPAAPAAQDVPRPPAPIGFSTFNPFGGLFR